VLREISWAPRTGIRSGRPDRPRERLYHGRRLSLADAELLAISHCNLAGRSAWTPARDLLTRCSGSLSGLPMRGGQLGAVRGVGPVKAVRLAATESPGGCAPRNGRGQVVLSG
jgi:DNA repair protein RadC